MNESYKENTLQSAPSKCSHPSSKSQRIQAADPRFLFKKWLNIETRIGDAAGQEKAKTRAREWVAANAEKKQAQGGAGSVEADDDEEEDEEEDDE